MLRKTTRSSVDCAVVDVWKRAVGELSTRNFAQRLAASEDLVLRLDVFRKLEKHRGCVNTVSFNADGDIVISGSDDQRIILWDWETGKIALSFHSGHHNNVFQAKIMPYTDARSIVTCAADGQVRQAQILEHGKVETKLLAKHQGRAHKLAIEPASPHIVYTCGEDGLVQHGSTARQFHLFDFGGDEDNGIYFFGDGSDDDYGGSSDDEDEDDSDMDEDEDNFSDGMDDDDSDDDDDDNDDDGFENLDIHEDGNGDEFFDTVGDPDFDDSSDNDQDSLSDSCCDDDDSNENDIDE